MTVKNVYTSCLRKMFFMLKVFSHLIGLCYSYVRF